MTNILELGVLFIFGGACFAMGIYLASQLGTWINKKIKKDE